MARQINLYNPALRRRRELLSLSTVALAALALTLALAAGGGVMRWRAGAIGDDLRAVDSRMAAETVQLGKLTSPAAQAAAGDLAALQKLVAERREVLGALRGSVGVDAAGGGFADYLRGLARQTVSGLWLTGFAVARGGENMEIRGRMLEAASLPDYIRRLNSEPSFHGRQFLSLSVDRPPPAAPVSPAAAPAAAAAVASATAPPAASFNNFVLTSVVPATAGKDKETPR